MRPRRLPAPSTAVPSARAATLAAMALAAALSGCASPAPTMPVNEYAGTLDGWRGQSEQALVARWGPPQSVEDTGTGGRWLTYVQGVEGAPRSSLSIGIGGFGFGGGGRTAVGAGVSTTVPLGGGAPPDAGCVTRFYVENGAIVRWTVDGTQCRVPG